MSVSVRMMTADDVPAAEQVCRLAFGTFFGLEDPAVFRGDGESISGRFHANPECCFVAETDGRLVGSAVVMDWGSVAVLGPLTVDVASWSRGIARALMGAVTEWMDGRGYAFTGLMTHPHSPKHVRLYEAFGYAMDRITPVMSKPVPPGGPDGAGSLYSALSPEARTNALAACRAVTERVHPGLDLSREIECVAALGLGDTVLIERDGKTTGFAVCHHGPRSEASSARLLVKFGGVGAGLHAAENFARLLAACEDLARRRGAPEIVAGTNSGRVEAYRLMREAGYRTFMNGIAMMRPPGVGYNRPDVYVIDDWR